MGKCDCVCCASVYVGTGHIRCFESTNSELHVFYHGFVCGDFDRLFRDSNVRILRYLLTWERCRFFRVDDVEVDAVDLHC